MTEPKTVVVFRKYKDNGAILALFPFVDEGNYKVSCYEHQGQHGLADYAHCIAITNPAGTDEYAKLQRELESIGYDLDIKTKRMRK